MPWINGTYYLNPAHGRARERARRAEAQRQATRPASDDTRTGDPRQSNATLPQRGTDDDGHWVTIDHRHVLIHEAAQAKAQIPAGQITGDATYYNLPGRKTASGEVFDPRKMAGAMTAEKAKLGQKVIVTYTHSDKDGKMVTSSIAVTVNDRGPFARSPDGKAKLPLQPAPGAAIDLTPAAFRKLVGTTKPGRVPVTVTVPDE